MVLIIYDVFEFDKFRVRWLAVERFAGLCYSSAVQVPYISAGWMSWDIADL